MLIDTLLPATWHATAGTAHKPLPGILAKFEPTLKHYGYFAVGGILLLENIGLPVPGETILIAAALYAATGELNIWLVGLVAVLASTAGSALGFLIGEYGGRPLAEKYGKYVFLTEERLAKTETFFQKRGWVVVLLGRYVEGVRQAAGIIAGISEMTFKKFLGFTLLGAAMWVTTWSLVGELAGSHVETISHYATYVAIGVGVLIVLFIIRAVVRSRRNGGDGGDGGVPAVAEAAT